jgi:hypothetical protein
LFGSQGSGYEVGVVELPPPLELEPGQPQVDGKASGAEGVPGLVGVGVGYPAVSEPLDEPEEVLLTGSGPVSLISGSGVEGGVCPEVNSDMI